MGLLSIFQRKSDDRGRRDAEPRAGADAVQEARLRARRRLIGAAVLVVIGVIGFPLLFESQPRPIPVDIPIEIPRKDASPALAMPTVRPAKPAPAVPIEPIAEPAVSASASNATASSAPVITETRADAGRERPALTAQTEPAPPKPVPVTPKPVVNAAVMPTLSSTPAHVAAAEAKHAQAAPDGQSSDASDTNTQAGRFVVQVGAFAESSAARDMRHKVEKLGLKTYTQMTQTSAGNRIRVRVGPFASRDEAERVQAKIKATGTPAVVLTL